MKNLILSLVIAIVSSVNGFGQSQSMTIFFTNDSKAVFIAAGGSNYIEDEDVEVRTYKLTSSNETFVLNHNDTIKAIGGINNINIEKVEKINLSELENEQYFLDDSLLYYKSSEVNYVSKFVFYGHVEASTVSVENQVEISNLTLYPNPVQDILNIRFDSYENVDVVVTDLNGRVVYNENVYGFTSVDLSNQPTGIYFVNVGSTTKKVIKQ